MLLYQVSSRFFFVALTVILFQLLRSETSARTFSSSDIQPLIASLSLLRLNSLSESEKLNTRDLFKSDGPCGEKNGAVLFRGEDGKVLSKICHKIQNYFVIEDELKKCGIPTNIVDAAAFAGYKENILQGAAGANPMRLNDLCNRARRSLNGKLEQIHTAATSDINRKLLASVTENSLRNAAQLYFTISKTFPGGEDDDKYRAFLCQTLPGCRTNSPKFNTNSKDIFSTLCGGYNCKGPAADILKSELARMETASGKNLKRFTSREVADGLNLEIQSLNTELVRVSADVDRGILFDSPKTETANKSYVQYLAQYQRTIDSPFGKLLTVPSLGRVHGIKTLENDLKKQTSNGQIRYGFEQYPKVSVQNTKFSEYLQSGSGRSFDSDTIGFAVMELKAEIVKEVDLLSSVGNNTAGTTDMEGAIAKISDLHVERDLFRMVRTNPVAIGQTLINNPELSGYMCEVIKGSAQQKETDERWKKRFVVGGGTALATATVLTAGAALAGYGVLATAATTAVTAGSTAYAAGTVGITADRYRSAALNLRSLQAGNSNDVKVLSDYERASSELEHELAKGILTPIGTASVLKAAGAIGKIKPADKAVEQMQKFSKTIQTVMSKGRSGTAQFFKRFAKVGGDEGRLISEMSKKLSPEELEDFIKAADGMSDTTLRELAQACGGV